MQFTDSCKSMKNSVELFIPLIILWVINIAMSVFHSVVGSFLVYYVNGKPFGAKELYYFFVASFGFTTPGIDEVLLKYLASQPSSWIIGFFMFLFSLIIAMIVGAYFMSGFFSMLKDFVKKGKTSFKGFFVRSKEHFKNFLLFQIVIVILLLLAGTPFLFGLLLFAFQNMVGIIFLFFWFFSFLLTLIIFLCSIFFAIPILFFENVGPFKLIKKSWRFLITHFNKVAVPSILFYIAYSIVMSLLLMLLSMLVIKITAFLGVNDLHVLARVLLVFVGSFLLQLYFSAFFIIGYSFIFKAYMSAKSIKYQKIMAVIIAVFFSFFTWLYTYKKDAWKFWLSFILFFLTLGLWIIPAWFWAVIESSNRSSDWYDSLNASKKRRA